MPFHRTQTKERTISSRVTGKPFQPAALALAISATQLSLVATEVAAAESSAQESVQLEFNVKAASLVDVLNQIASQADITLTFEPEKLKTLESKGLKGRYSVNQALKKVLQYHGFKAIMLKSGGYTLRTSDDMTALDQVTIIGKELRFGDIAESDGFKADYQTSATKMAMTLKETPQAISVVTRDLLDMRQVDGLHHALELTSGTQGVSSGLAAPSGPFTGRGTRASGYNIRGHYLSDQSLKTDGFATGSLAEIDLAAYERVDVIKGPSGFFGQGGIGGIINLVRKKPHPEFDASISGQTGSYDTYRTEVDITGSLIKDESLRGRLVIASGDEGSFVDDIATETTLIAPGFEAIINDNTRILLQALHQKEVFDINNGQPAYIDGDRIKLFDLPRSYNFGATGDDRSKTEITDISVRVDHELSDQWLTTLLLQGSQISRDAVQGNYGYLVNENVDVLSRRETYEKDLWAGEIRLEGVFDAFDQEHKLLFGLEHNRSEQIRNNGWNYFYDNNGNTIRADIYTTDFSSFGVMPKEEIKMLYRVGDTVDIKNTALYAQAILSLAERTKLLANARYDKTNYKNTNTAGSYLIESSDDEWTIRLGLTQEINNNVSAYVTYGESFDPSLSDGRKGPLGATRGEGYELGVKTDWFDNKIGATLAIYRQDLTDRPINDPENGPGEYYSISAGLHRTEGVEFELSGSPMDGLNLALAATWMDNEFLDKNDELYGFPIDGSADQQFSVYGNYEIQQGPLKGLAAGIMWLNTGDRNMLPWDRSSGRYKQVYLDGYERFDLDFSYNGIPNLGLSLVIRNVLDKKYIETGSSSMSRQHFVGAPRSALFKATYNF